MSTIKLKHSGGNGVIIAAPSSNPAADRTITCPDLAANAVMATTNGITEFDHYYLTSNWTTNYALMTSWARVTTSVAASSASPIGSGISHSNGIFTFPSTGKYLVIVNGVFEIVSDDHIYILVKVTQNNSSYVTYTSATDGNGGSATRNGSGTAFALLM